MFFRVQVFQGPGFSGSSLFMVQVQVLEVAVLRKRYSENMQQINRRTPCRSVISIKLFCNFIEIALRHGCFPVNLLHIFRKPFPKNTSGWLLQNLALRMVQISKSFC